MGEKVNDSGSVLVMIIIVIMILMTLSTTILVMQSTNVQTISLNEERVRNEYNNTYIKIPNIDPFIKFIIEENVFVYGNNFVYSGDYVSGPGATVVVNGDLLGAEINKGANIDVTYIYINGKVDFGQGSISLGSSTHPGDTYINGDLLLTTGQHQIYGTVHVSNNLYLKDAEIYGNIYVNGNVTLNWTPIVYEPACIYYTGSLTHPSSMSTDITSKCIKVSAVPAFEMPTYPLPVCKQETWYAENGYIAGGPLVNGIKIYADNYISESGRPDTENVVIVSKGDISITGMGGSGLSGVLFAPNGRVTFEGDFFEGVVIAEDGFFVTSGGTTVTFKNIENYIEDTSDYPFET